MLRVTVELVPFGREAEKQKIAEMVIANNTLGGYEAWTAPDDWSGEPARYGYLQDHDRRKSVWELIRLMLECIRLEDHKPKQDKGSLAQRLYNRISNFKREA